jgi:hypothetical protein
MRRRTDAQVKYVFKNGRKRAAVEQLIGGGDKAQDMAEVRL